MFPHNSVVEKMAVGYWIPVFGQESEEAPLIDLGWIGPTGQMYSTTADLNKVRNLYTLEFLIKDTLNEENPLL